LTDINPRRLVLGDQLRLLRESAGISGKQLAQRLGWPASKISRIENARQAVTDGDLVAIGDGLNLPDDVRQELRDELRAIRVEEARFSQRVRVGHRGLQNEVAAAEADARRIRVFSLALVPGLAQTAEYARHVFDSLAELHHAPRDTAEAVQSRMDRQTILYREGKSIELLMTEFALRNPIAPAPVMQAQVDRLLALQGLPSLVRFGIIPLGQQIPPAAAHNFVIRDDSVTIELINTEVATRDPDDVRLYDGYLERLWAQAAEGDHARAILRRRAEAWSRS
jgi:transcriptional regulator with XRE-family HTH domain